MIDLSDRLAIHELLGLYGHIIDAREWDRLGELFTVDIEFDAADFGQPILHGIEAVRSLWEITELHPLAHHATNIVVTAVSPIEAAVLSKGIGVGRGGKVGSVTYHDTVRREAGGWRIARRKAVPRKA